MQLGTIVLATQADVSKATLQRPFTASGCFTDAGSGRLLGRRSMRHLSKLGRSQIVGTVARMT